MPRSRLRMFPRPMRKPPPKDTDLLAAHDCDNDPPMVGQARLGRPWRPRLRPDRPVLRLQRYFTVHRTCRAAAARSRVGHEQASPHARDRRGDCPRRPARALLSNGFGTVDKAIFSGVRHCASTAALGAGWRRIGNARLCRWKPNSRHASTVPSRSSSPRSCASIRTIDGQSEALPQRESVE